MPIPALAHNIQQKNTAYALIVLETITKSISELSMFMANPGNYSNARIPGSGQAVQQIDQFVKTLGSQTHEQKLNALRELAKSLGSGRPSSEASSVLLLRQARVAEQSDCVSPVCYSPDGKVFAGSDGNTAGVWDGDTGKVRFMLSQPEDGGPLSFSPDSKLMALAHSDYRVRIWDLTQRGRALLVLSHQKKIHDVKFSPDGHTIATGSDDNTMILWDSSSGHRVQNYQNNAPVTSLLFAPRHGRWLATFNRNDVFIWDTANGQKKYILSQNAEVDRFAVSPNGEWLATTSLQNRGVLLWDTNRGVQATAFPHFHIVDDFAFSPAGDLLATASNKQVQFWQLPGANLLSGSQVNREITQIVFSPDGSLIATACEKTVTLWEVKTGNKLCSFSQEEEITSIAFQPSHPTGKRLITASDMTGVQVLELGHFTSL